MRESVACVFTLSQSAVRGTVKLAGLSFPCALGRTGSRTCKREGDGATPIGRWHVHEVLYRPDRLRRPSTPFPARAIRPHDGWCDAPADRNYNRAVRLPYPASAEHMWRQDGLYDVVAVLAYNDRPRHIARGSAIFMHVAKPGHMPTDGCIALERPHLLRLLDRLGSRATVCVRPSPKKGARSFRFGR